MAIVPSANYHDQTNVSSDYPLGAARNRATPGDVSGFPLEKDWVNDLLGWQQALLTAAEIEASGAPDTATSSQYLDAIQALIDVKADVLSARVSVLESIARRPGVFTIDGPQSRTSGATLHISEALDPASQYSQDGSSGRIVVSDAGYYEVHAVVPSASSSSPDMPQIGLQLYLGGTLVSRSAGLYAAGSEPGLYVTGIVRITDPTNQWINLRAFCNSDATLHYAGGGVLTLNRIR